MSPRTHLPRWRIALAMALMLAGVAMTCAPIVAHLLGKPSQLYLVGIVGGLVCGALGGILTATRITCRQCGKSIISVGSQPRHCPMKNCPRCGAAFFEG